MTQFLLVCFVCSAGNGTWGPAHAGQVFPLSSTPRPPFSVRISNLLLPIFFSSRIICLLLNSHFQVFKCQRGASRRSSAFLRIVMKIQGMVKTSPQQNLHLVFSLLIACLSLYTQIAYIFHQHRKSSGGLSNIS